MTRAPSGPASGGTPCAGRIRLPRGLVVVLISFLTTALPCASAPEGGRSASLAQILTGLAERGALYERTAVRFSCQEEATRTTYDKNEKIRSRETVVHDYLLEYTEDGGLKPYRAQIEKEGKTSRRRPVETDYHVPEPYAWNLLFTAENQGRFDYRLAGPDVQQTSFTWIVEFFPTTEYDQGTGIDEWQGRAWIDQDSLDLLRVEAVPARQDDLVKAALEECRTSFRVFGKNTKGCPKRRKVTVEFGYEREGLRFPTRAFATTRVVNLYTGDPERLEETVALVYDGYAFYGVDTLEEFQRLRTPEEP